MGKYADKMGQCELKTAFLFPGQASQKVGMGKDLFESSKLAKKYFKTANEIMGFDFSKIIFDGPKNELTKTIYTQPAIYLVSVILGKLLINKGVLPVCCAGHSLGEYSAFTIAGAFDFQSGFELVKLRAESMQLASEKRGGTMAAVLGLNDDKVNEICNNYNEGTVVVANYNCNGQVVISGDINSIKSILEPLKNAGAIKVIKLNVGGAFHSPLMSPAKKALSNKLKDTLIKDISIPVYANFSSMPVMKSSEILISLVNQLDNPVYWHMSIKKMKNENIDTVIEVGPGKVLQALNRRIDSSLKIIGVESYNQIDEFNYA